MAEKSEKSIEIILKKEAMQATLRQRPCPAKAGHVAGAKR